MVQSYAHAADLLAAQGQGQRALELLGQSLEAEKTLVEQHPSDLDLKRELETLALHAEQIRQRFRKGPASGSGQT